MISSINTRTCSYLADDLMTTGKKLLNWLLIIVHNVESLFVPATWNESLSNTRNNHLSLYEHAAFCKILSLIFWDRWLGISKISTSWMFLLILYCASVIQLSHLSVPAGFTVMLQYVSSTRLSNWGSHCCFINYACSLFFHSRSKSSKCKHNKVTATLYLAHTQELYLF